MSYNLNQGSIIKHYAFQLADKCTGLNSTYAIFEMNFLSVFKKKN